VIYKANGPLKVMKLEALTKILTFKQGNKYVPGTLVVVIQAVEEGEVNWALWFTQKLHNEILVVQRKACRPRNTLIEPSFTI
jgi:hypothetical protein